MRAPGPARSRAVMCALRATPSRLAPRSVPNCCRCARRYVLRAREVRQLFRSFRRYDKRGNGSLQGAQLRLFMRRVGLKLSQEEADA